MERPMVDGELDASTIGLSMSESTCQASP
jgi:hypothetical protein